MGLCPVRRRRLEPESWVVVGTVENKRENDAGRQPSFASPQERSHVAINVGEPWFARCARTRARGQHMPVVLSPCRGGETGESDGEGA